MIKILKSYFNNKKGMSLVEVLTAMTLLALMIFCFTPLMLSYLNSINASGVKMERVYDESGKLQVLLGGGVTADGYTVSLDTVPVELTSPTATVNGTSVASATINSNVTAYGLSSAGTDTNALGDINVGNGYSTFYTDEYGSSSGIKLFPSTLTDDFKTAYITIYGNGIRFDDLSKCSFVATGTTSEIPLTQGVDYDIEYHPDRPNSDDRDLLLLTVYGGGDKISFETSPLVFKYFGQRYEIQVDAPSMIMVGEKSADNNYYYYVSRGEVDEDGYMLIHRREMTNAPLTSAMNDVEWVKASDGDGYNVDSDNESYGYYVMCGDEGQIRRFWKRPDTTITVDGKTVEVDGNYYWGGDYTYHTDINIDTNTSDTSNPVQSLRYNTTWTNSTAVEYTYVYRGSNITSNPLVTNVVGGYSNLRLFNSLLFSINALDTDKRNSNTNIEVYIPDGEVYWFEKKESKNSYPDLENSVSDRAAMNSVFNADGDYNNGTIGGQSVEGLNRYWNINLATDWIGLKDNSTYYAVNGQAQDANMITLTCVDAINMSNLPTSSTAGGPYYSVSTDGSTYPSSGIDYPTSSYNLYCGYIPAVMDLWANGNSRGDGRITRTDDWDKYTFMQVGNSSVRNDDNAYTADSVFYIGSNDNNGNAAASDFWIWPYWKGTYGLIPYTTNGGSTINYGGLQRALDSNIKAWVLSAFANRYWDADIVYYPFTNIGYAPIGKAFDSNTTIDSALVGPFTSIIPSDASRLVIPQMYLHDGDGFNQQNATGGNQIDITLSYLSHPLAISRSLNPTDDMVYDMSNNKSGNRVFYWTGTRDTATYLDCASTLVPSGENDIPVSLLVGYVTGGLAEYTGGNISDDAFINSIFTNGIVLLRAGKGNSVGAGSTNFDTGEERAMDNGGYTLTETSNAFHQFYFLNSRTNESEQPYRNHITIGDSIGNLCGAYFWQNNRHIDYVSVNGEKNAMSTGTFNSSSYEYLRCHPLTNTKVNCVTWGTSWIGNPVAMWGTDNGTLLSWKCEIIDDNNDGETVTNCTQGSGIAGLFSEHKAEDHSEYHNDRSVVAEFQSYKWIDNVNKTENFAITSDAWLDSLGSAKPDSKNAQQYAFTSANFEMYEGFYDACSRIAAAQLDNNKDIIKAVGFISTLESVNDVSYSDDIWVACGDQSDANPATYCGTGNFAIGNADAGTNFVTRPYITADNYQKTTNPSISGEGSSKGSWINVNYWIDVAGTGKQNVDNRLYQWSAVQISTEANCNIVQINNVNGMWVATGYKDANGNDDYDDGEEARIFWTYDPRIPCGVTGGWSAAVKMYDGSVLEDYSDGTSSNVLDEMGGINSCATRDE